MRYFPCELHCHTLHSDGSFTVYELQSEAKKEGLSLIALTDHNTLSGQKELNDDIIPAVRGIEWTTYFGHMLVLGAKRFVDWRDAVPDNIDEKIKEVKNNGGLVGIAHPFQLGSPMCTGGRWEFNVKDFDNIDYVEIWHQSFSDDNYENDRATLFWTKLLDEGHKIAATYGRDWHRKEKSGHYGCTYLGIDGESITEEKALEAINKGRTVVSTGTEFSFFVRQVDKEYNIGDTLSEGEAEFIFNIEDGCNSEHKEIRIISNGGKCIESADAYAGKISLCLEKGKWYRAELWGVLHGKTQALAITSPIYVKGENE